MAPWLTDFVLAKLESSSQQQEIDSPTSSPPPQLIQILERGGDWWTNPINSNKEAWVTLSDGTHYVKSILTPSAMQHILEEQPIVRNNNTNNSVYRFYTYSRGSCALIRDYKLKIQKTDVTGTTSILLSVGSIEAKPGFHLPIDGQHNDSVQQAVDDDINVRYAIQTWNENQEARNQQQQVEEDEESENEIANTNAACPPNKRRRTVPLGDVFAAVMNNPKTYNEILRLTEEQERIEFQNAENTEIDLESQQISGAFSQDPATQPLLETQPPPQYPHHSSNNQGKDAATPDSQSSMRIQNVLMSEESEQEDDDSTVEQTPKPGERNSQHVRPHVYDSPLNNEQRVITTWDFVKEQLNDPNCKIIVFQAHHNNDTTVSHRSSGTPATNSGDYLCKYGLARWLHHNLEH
jgi:hypothetical protein